MDYIETLPNGNLLFIGVANKQDKANIIESFNDAIGETFFDWKIFETLKEFFKFTSKKDSYYNIWTKNSIQKKPNLLGKLGTVIKRLN